MNITPENPTLSTIRKVLRARGLSLLLLLISGAVLADEEVGISAVPDWVEEHQVAEFAADRSGQYQQGLAYLLNDRQVRKSDDGYEYVSRFAYRVVDRSGLEDAATITRTFDPLNEKLDFNFVRIVRDGEVVDRLSDAEITVLRQEERLESSVIDGSLTALIQLDDVRVGDVIDYSYSAAVATPLWPGEYFDIVSVEWAVPLAQLYYRLLVPDDYPIWTRRLATDIEPRVSTADGWTTFEIHVEDPDPVNGEQYVPDDWTMFGYIELTSMESWSDVVDWAIPVVSVDTSLPQSFIEKLDDIADQYPQPKDKATQVLRLVQSDIRYLGLEVGLGTHVPRPPATTLERGYGDCKDKSVLLAAALGYLGIEAYPALASTYRGDLLPQLPPAIDSFNHMIVGFTVGDDDFWVDPTWSHQGGTADNFASLDYGHVLPVRSGSSELVEIDVKVPDEPTLEISEAFGLPDSDLGQFTIDISYTYRDTMADFIRRQVAESGQDEYARNFLDYYASHYGGVSAGSRLSVSDDMDANIVELRAEYVMDARQFADSGLIDEFPVMATAVQDYIPRRIEANRTAPLGLPYGASARHKVRIATPGQILSVPGDKSRSVNGVSYSRQFDVDGEIMEIAYDLTVTEKQVALGDINGITDLGEEIADESEITIRISSAMQTTARLLQLDAPLDADLENRIAVARTQMRRDQHVEALTTLNSLIDANPEPTKIRGFLQLLRANTLVQMDREKAALAPFKEAFELHEPPAGEAYFPYINILRQEGDDVQTVQLIVRLLDHHPDAIDSFNARWLTGLARSLWESEMTEERDALVLAVARAAHETQPSDIDDFQWAFAEAARVWGSRNNAEEASQYLSYVKSPKNLARLLMSKDTEAIWKVVEDHAGADLSIAVERYLSMTLDDARNAPDDFRKQTRHLNALRMAGQFEQAVEYGKALAEDWPRIEAVGEDAFWYVNEYAYALADSGHPAQAHALMDKLVALGIPANGQLISMAINRAALLMNWGEFEAALGAIEDIESLDDTLASDYGRMWIYDTKACTLNQLGRIDEAQTVLQDSILPLADENPAAYTHALLCMDELDKAAGIIINRLQSRREQPNIILTFMELAAASSDAEAPFMAELTRRAEIVRARPDVRKEFDKIGRVVTMNGIRTYWGDF